jgi:hypothetical protein
MIFYILNDFKMTREGSIIFQGIRKRSQNQVAMCINKVGNTARLRLCLAHSNLHVNMTELSSCNQDWMASKAKNIYILVLYRNSVPLSTPSPIQVSKEESGNPHSMRASRPVCSVRASDQIALKIVASLYLHSEFNKVSLGYMRSYLKNER